jgi:hypothetical protein
MRNRDWRRSLHGIEFEQEILTRSSIIYGKLYSNLKCRGSHRVSLELYRLFHLFFLYCVLFFDLFLI